MRQCMRHTSTFNNIPFVAMDHGVCVCVCGNGFIASVASIHIPNSPSTLHRMLNLSTIAMPFAKMIFRARGKRTNDPSQWHRRFLFHSTRNASMGLNTHTCESHTSLQCNAAEERNCTTVYTACNTRHQIRVRCNRSRLLPRQSHATDDEHCV